MSALSLTVAVVALGTIVNSVLVIALAREIGTLHLRLRPNPLGAPEGPEEGWALAAVPFEPVSGDPGMAQDVLTGPSVLLYVMPGCAACRNVIQSVTSLRRQIEGQVRVAFVTDHAGGVVLDDYASRLPSPAIRADHLADRWSLPGSPFGLALVPDETGKSLIVRAAGIVNTTEQLELLLEAAQQSPTGQALAANSQVATFLREGITG